MVRTPIFNDYNENGYRVNAAGSRSHMTEDNAIVDNLRRRWTKELEEISDQTLLNAYDTFALSDYFGNNDAQFLEWLSEYESN